MACRKGWPIRLYPFSMVPGKHRWSVHMPLVLLLTLKKFYRPYSAQLCRRSHWAIQRHAHNDAILSYTRAGALASRQEYRCHICICSFIRNQLWCRNRTRVTIDSRRISNEGARVPDGNDRVHCLYCHAHQPSNRRSNRGAR